MLPGFETATGTDELLVEIETSNNALSNDYPGGEGSYESYGYYRYGFNGRENDNEVKGSGNQQDYGMRIYDPRLGRFLSVDPIAKMYPMLMPYQFVSNKPISGVDLDGLEYVHYWVFLDKQGNFIHKHTSEDFRKMTAEQISSVHHIPADDFYKENSMDGSTYKPSDNLGVFKEWRENNVQE